MTTMFPRTRKFVQENVTLKTYYAFCAGSTLTSIVILVSLRNIDTLRLTKEHAELLKQGGAIMYELKGQTVHLVNVHAVESLAALS
jgi:hypothetical protein